MNNPCKRCVLVIICDEICPYREDYVIFCKEELDKYIKLLINRSSVPNFDSKYYEAYLRYETVKEDDRIRFAYKGSMSSTSSGGSSSYRTPTLLDRKRRRMCWHSYKIPESQKRADDYLRHP
jgi:hypothetical protein